MTNAIQDFDTSWRALRIDQLHGVLDTSADSLVNRGRVRNGRQNPGPLTGDIHRVHERRAPLGLPNPDAIGDTVVHPMMHHRVHTEGRRLLRSNFLHSIPPAIRCAPQDSKRAQREASAEFTVTQSKYLNKLGPEPTS